MTTPFLRVEESGELMELTGDVTTVGRGEGVDIQLAAPTEGGIAQGAVEFK